MSMTPEEARVALYNEVYVPAFINKCAEAGLTFNSADEVAQALENAALVKSACEKANTAQSSELMKTANTTLKAALGIEPEKEETPEKTAEVNTTVRDALAALRDEAAA